MGFSFSGRVSNTWLLAGGSLTPALTDTRVADVATWRSIILLTRVQDQLNWHKRLMLNDSSRN